MDGWRRENEWEEEDQRESLRVGGKTRQREEGEEMKNQVDPDCQVLHAKAEPVSSNVPLRTTC